MLKASEILQALCVLVGLITRTAGNEMLVNVRQLNGLQNEFQVNTYTTGKQNDPAVAGLSGGGFVIAWSSKDQDGSDYGVFAQRYDSSGAAEGAEFQVNTYITNEQQYPAVAGLSGGGFVIVWASSGQDGSAYGVYAQLYDSSGTTVGSEFRVNTHTTSYQYQCTVTSFSGGGFVVVWASSGQDGSGYGVYGQLYDSSGVAVGSEFQINTYTTTHQVAPAVSSFSDGRFVVTWSSMFQDGAFYGIYAQLFDASGSKVGSEFQVNTFTADNELFSSVTTLSTGGFIITWMGNNHDTSGFGVYAQLFDSSGAAVGSEFRVNTHTTNNQQYPVVASSSTGGFLIAWGSNSQDGSAFGVFAQRFDSSGDVVGSEFQVNTYTSNDQKFPAIATLAGGGYIVAWQSAAQDGSDDGIYGQFVSAFPPTSNPTLLPTSPPTEAVSDHIVVHLYDTHGDGWHDSLYLHAKHANGTELYSLHCSCKVVRIFAVDVSLSLWRNRTVPGPKGDVVPYEWEAFWTVGYSDGVTETDFGIVGDVKTKVEIRNYDLSSAEFAVDVDHRKPPNRCIPPKPKPKATPVVMNETESDHIPDTPSPIVDVRLVLLTTNGEGWCDDTGNWSVLSCDKEHFLSSDALLPNLILYPRYYISRTDDNWVVASGTLREDTTEWTTSVKLLREGSYVLSVSGRYTASIGSASWDFCGEQGGINERLHFDMMKGVCHPRYIEEVNGELTCYEELNGQILSNSVDKLHVSGDVKHLRHLFPGLLVACGAMLLVALALVHTTASRNGRKKFTFDLDTTEEI